MRPIRRTLPLLAAIVALLTVEAAVPHAAGAQVRSADSAPRWWWTASASAQGTRLVCDLCDTSRDLGPALDFVIGRYATPGTRVGLEAGYATTTNDGTRETVWSSGLVAELHPREGSGLHLIGGLGWAGYRAASFAYDAVRLRLGVGWDLPLAGSWVVGNRLTYDASSWGSLRSDGAPVMESVGLGTIRFGMYVGRR